jgi:hypothetical protein
MRMFASAWARNTEEEALAFGHPGLKESSFTTHTITDGFHIQNEDPSDGFKSDPSTPDKLRLVAEDIVASIEVISRATNGAV